MADPANTTLGKMLMDHITPVVMVLSTPLVEDSCHKNGLSFVDLLSPFSSFDNVDVPVRTASDQPYRIRKFRLRLFYASDIRKPEVETAKAWLKKVVTDAGEKDNYHESSELHRNENILPLPESKALPSWFQIFNQELIQASSFSDHEAFDHPVACLLVVSSKDEEPINKFVDLFNNTKLPALLNDGAMDPKILKHYIVLHDNQDGPLEKASKILSEMKNTYGSNDCQLLCINSSQGGSVDSQANPWSSCKQIKEHFLDTDNIDQIKVLMQDLTTKHVIPHMEQKIRALNQQVSATRKGFKNQIKNLWWRKGREDTQDTPDGPAYTFSSTESQIRVLGDYAFMLRDYDLALSNYRLISMDYKLDKSWKRYAGVQEMMALTYFMMDQASKEAESCLDSAFTTYLKLGLRGQQNAVRCGLWWAEMLKARDQYKEAASVYFRVSGEEPLQSAVMLEQASYCYLFSVPQMLRKYGFHLILSGDSYKKCDQMKHGIRTYKTALSVFSGTSWGLIKDHIHFQLGKWFALLGMFDVAIEHMLEILACTHQSKAAQELFLGDFLELVQKTGKTFEVCRLRLPVVKLPSLRVVFEDHRTYASPAAVGVRESIWKSLEEDMIPSLSNAKSNWLELHTKLVPKKCKQSSICIAGEAIKIDIGFSNPLQIPILISNVSLMCKYFITSDEMERDDIVSSTNLQNDEQLRELIAGGGGNADKDAFTLSEVEFSLNGGETLLVHLTVTPKVEGILKVVGVRWKLSGSVVGFQIFESDQVKRKNAHKRKPKQSNGNELTFLVIKSLPKLEGSIRSLPKKSYLGEVHRLVLELKNHSKVPVKNLKVRISHPRFLAFGSREALNLEFPASLRMDNNEKLGHAVQSDETASLFQFPEDFVIQGEEPVLWPIWFRAALPGMISLYLTIYYEVGDESSVMRYRTLRMCHICEVLPSLDVSFHVSRCPSRLREFLVHMDLVNKASSQSFEIHQLSCLGDQWDITMLQPMNIPSPIMAGQALSCFFKLQDGRKATVKEDETSHFESRGSHVRLGAKAHNEDLFDVSASPFADFHKHERFHEEKLEQRRYAETVDFILISHPHNMSTESADHSRLFSHHICLSSVASNGPLCWMMDGPRMIYHNFGTSLCEINLRIRIHNSLDAAVSVRIDPNESGSSTSQSNNSNAVSSENRAGWHEVSVASEGKITSDTLGNTRHDQQMSGENASPFMWCGSSSTRVKVAPLSTTEVPIQICVFAPGTYDISNYQLHWELLQSEGDVCDADSKQSSGIFPGQSFYLTVLQST
ncbi:trafficking protein particle complex subunit 8-like [Chenopodium quinoa]|uniref:trafficking protein particle complex subunit 8-like n=1 Tax=Chenopodium quinoa TaxID=63459 RepID=UPI000B76CCBA|nr:trafficking protein particle complex subunit 8-like [Chenopodium quinoa]